MKNSVPQMISNASRTSIVIIPKNINGGILWAQTVVMVMMVVDKHNIPLRIRRSDPDNCTKEQNTHSAHPEDQADLRNGTHLGVHDAHENRKGDRRKKENDVDHDQDSADVSVRMIVLQNIYSKPLCA